MIRLLPILILQGTSARQSPHHGIVLILLLYLTAEAVIERYSHELRASTTAVLSVPPRPSLSKPKAVIGILVCTLYFHPQAVEVPIPVVQYQYYRSRTCVSVELG